jgi:hypothetical protein
LYLQLLIVGGTFSAFRPSPAHAPKTGMTTMQKDALWERFQYLSNFNVMNLTLASYKMIHKMFTEPFLPGAVGAIEDQKHT